MTISSSDNSLIILDDFIHDKSGKRRYRMICKICSKNRGYQRPSKRKLTCMSCGQTGKLSGRKGTKLSKEQKQNISKANHVWRKKQNPTYVPDSPLIKKIKHSLRSRLWQAIKNGDRGGSAVNNLGCSIEEFKSYIESKFLPEMNWYNWSRTGWHIDHIDPLDNFDLTNLEELKKACHYTNLQPLWARDNLSKGARIGGR